MLLALLVGCAELALCVVYRLYSISWEDSGLLSMAQ